MTLSVFLGGPIQHATSGAQFYTPLKRDLEAAIAQLREEGHRVFSAHLDEAFGAMEADFTPERVSRRDFGWGFTVTLYETSSCAREFHHPGERRRWPDLRASLSQACRTTSPGTVGDDLLPTVSP
ncbi:hypothetical protein [Phenylobacterium sp.]|uniref:hypothetical protein n=1 Tax=Phenylobacterium sp. TaxID=1871053 RepID=UPI0025E4ADFB|nr:hypothetical protein [Phenylobacterium sp.]MCA6323713.1 hypothetical protein [Phenylobacterium sp.]MCA6337903.1 hypothetical protein [Phenylobacterium sp.]MCA6341129.1 hypothetical protein [Phenylobacterium sp.]MCA6343824.1 hypothetical protein [Phenylobacterium sp.]MCA6345278.1 hypothetical protein [Phenylobacterium sp.]